MYRQQQPQHRQQSRWRPALLFSLLMLAAIIAFCPRPELYDGSAYSAAVNDRHGQLLRLMLADDERYRLFVNEVGIPESVRAATLLYEDRYFTYHPGINPVALLRAAWATYISQTRVIGASTITMQLARMRFDLDTRTVAGKLMQMARAIQLERHYSKARILEAYLNLAPYGGNIEGIATAALIYFDKPLDQLGLPEVLSLVVIPQNPTARNPVTSQGYRTMIAARDRLYTNWRSQYGIETDQDAMFALPLAIRGPTELPFLAPHFARDFLARRVGANGIHRSSVDLSLQQLLERQVTQHLARLRDKGLSNASALLLDSRSMEILASVGSADFFDDHIAGQVNGTQAKRSPGSTLKPFIYALAMDRGLIHPMSLMKDAPKHYGLYTPENFDRGFFGPVMARDALIYSRNVPAVSLLARLGEKDFHGFLQDAGVTGMREPEHYGLALALGGNEVTMEELVTLYAMLANGGRLQSLRDTPISLNDYQRSRKASGVGNHGPAQTLIAAGHTRTQTSTAIFSPAQFPVAAAPESSPTSITMDADGRVTDPPSPAVLSAEASFMILDILRDNPRPDTLAITGHGEKRPMAWKTGTSYAYRDAWSVGVYGPYVLAVWVGNFDGRSNPHLVGRAAAAPLLFAIADALPMPTADLNFLERPPASLNLRKVAVCTRTGDLPGAWCPETTDSWFIPGVSPIKVSDIHRAVRINSSTGLRSCNAGTDGTRLEVYEFWPSDLATLIRQAGIAIRRPPPFEPGCNLDRLAATGAAPAIVTPDADITYRLRPHRIAEERLSFTAISDADVDSLYWFVDSRFIARSTRNDPVYWQPQIGNFTVSVVDNHGRASARPLTVKVAR